MAKIAKDLREIRLIIEKQYKADLSASAFNQILKIIIPAAVEVFVGSAIKKSLGFGSGVGEE